MKHAGEHGLQGRKRSVALWAACLGSALLLLILVLPIVAGADVDAVATCLDPCHVPPGFMGPDVETAYLGAGENAGHSMDWNARVVEDTSAAMLSQGSRMPCDECHVTHGSATTNIYLFDSTRTGSPVATTRQLCEGCHIPHDSSSGPAVVCGLVLKKLPSGVTDHGDASNRPCSDCHGPSGHAPASHGGGDCGDSGCHGGSGSHAVHLSASDPRGPGVLGCTDDCHLSGDFPYFKAGTDSDISGHIELDETTVCDTCHSPGGDYDGVDSAAAPSGAMSVGAKDNWTTKIYETTTTIKPGKERWCAGCHDGDASTPGEEPSLIDGVYAPPVIGDEGGSSLYGTGWGYYETGHGVPSSTVLPSNGYAAGPDLDCDTCHAFGETHIDGERRSHDSGTSSNAYRSAYRLDLVSSANPMEIPWAAGAANDATRARLCYQSGCHSYSQINNAASQETNFWLADGVYYYDAWQYNMHEFHLDFGNQLRWVSDYSSNAYPGDSQISCPTCHNVHGSKYLAMTRDGEITSEVYERRPGLRMWYRNLGFSAWNPNDANPPTPEDIPLSASDGWVWRPATASTVCSHCHGGNNNTRDFNRTLWQSLGIAPVIGWTGETGYTDDGVEPDSGSAEETFAFRAEYTDGNNDAPTFVVLRIDLNDDGDCNDASETVTMDPDNPGDATYYNGNFYNVDLQLAKAGDDILPYNFETSDGVSGTSMSETRTVTITNAAPKLPWTGETGYADDGVNPNSGTTGITDYEFRILYRDADGEAPSGGAPTLYFDKNDDGDYGDAGESVTMSPMSGGDYIAGKRYNHTSKLTYNIDGLIPYYFEASDGIDTTQSVVSTVTVLENVNQAPVLSWTGETGYAADGVDPENQAGGKPFYFRVEYTDANNDAPGTKEVWIDLNDDGSYAVGEKFTMDDTVTASDPTKTDGDYSNGEYYAEKVYVPYATDGTLTYCFYFTDSSAAEATGDPQDDGVPANDSTLTVFDAIDVPGDGYATIQAAVNAASTGDTVLVADGTWAGFDYLGKDITVDSVNGAGSTFIDGGGSGTLVTFNNGSNSTLRGFTVQNGALGIYSNTSDVTIQECVIDSNSGAGINHLSDSGYLLLVEDSTISNNQPGIIGNNGGGRITLRRTNITGNTVSGNGAGITSNGCNLYTFEDSTFSNNIAGGSGGALYNVSSTFTMIVRDCIIEGNQATGGHGGGMAFNNGTSVTVERTIVRGNSASGNGGGFWHQGGTYNYTNATFSGNYAGGDGGGVDMATNSGTPTFNFCTFSGNSANRGGGLFVNWPSAGQAKVLNCVMYGDDSRSSVVLEEIDGGNYLNTRVQYTDINQAFGSFNSQVGNYTANPIYVSGVAAGSAPTNTGDYHLQAGSPCEGAADPVATLVDDIDKGTRPQGTGRDSGSDEIGAVGASIAPEKSFSVSLPRTGPVDELSTRVTSARSSAVTAPGMLSAQDSSLDDPITAAATTAQDLPPAYSGSSSSLSADSAPDSSTPPAPATVPMAIGLASISGLAIKELLSAR